VRREEGGWAWLLVPQAAATEFGMEAIDFYCRRNLMVHVGHTHTHTHTRSFTHAHTYAFSPLLEILFILHICHCIPEHVICAMFFAADFVSLA